MHNNIKHLFTINIVININKLYYYTVGSELSIFNKPSYLKALKC